MQRRRRRRRRLWSGSKTDGEGPHEGAVVGGLGFPAVLHNEHVIRQRLHPSFDDRKKINSCSSLCFEKYVLCSLSDVTLFSLDKKVWMPE